MAEEPQEVFAYADPITQSGITVERSDSSLRVTTPPEKFTKIHRGYHFGLAFSLYMLGAGVVETIVIGPTMIGVLIEGLVFTLTILTFIYIRIRTTTAFAIEDGFLRVTRYSPPFAPQVRSWHLSEISDARFNPSNGKVLVRVIGKSFVEFYISRKKELAQYVAQVLSEEIRRLSRPMVEGVAQAMPVANPRSKVMVSLIITLAVIPMMLIVVFPQLAGIWLIMLFVPAVVAGITFGTQKKDYWI